MNLASRKSLAVITVSVVVVAAVWWYSGRESEPGPTVRRPPPSTSAATTRRLPAPSNVVEPTAAPAPEAATPRSAVEMAGTERMVLAHAPLRTPEVADPDSAANRQILRTMVAKALHNASELQDTTKPIR